MLHELTKLCRAISADRALHDYQRKIVEDNLLSQPTLSSLQKNYGHPVKLSALDDEFLPDVDLEHGNLTYTVVLGEVLGNWEAEKPSMGAS
jgi:hypothetical protein